MVNFSFCHIYTVCYQIKKKRSLGNFGLLITDNISRIHTFWLKMKTGKLFQWSISLIFCYLPHPRSYFSPPLHSPKKCKRFTSFLFLQAFFPRPYVFLFRTGILRYSGRKWLHRFTSLACDITSWTKKMPRINITDFYFGRKLFDLAWQGLT